jgi:hypothetical protein
MAKRKPLFTLDTESRLRRQAGRRPQRRVILVVCEGQTEEAYFHAIREHYRHQTHVNVQIERADSDPVKVVEKGKRRNKQNDFDRVFCVVDGDKSERIEAARRRIGKRSDLELIVSTPCFEVWLLLHFEASDAPFVECAKVCDRLRQQLPDYVKGQRYDFARIVSRSDDAISNAEWLAARGLDNPATHLHRLLILIRATP